MALKNSVCRFWRQVPEHPPDVREEAHIQHPVRLVQHQVLDAGQLGVRHPEVVEQPPGRGDQHVHSAPEGVLLRPHPDTAEDCGPGDRGVHRQIVQIFQDLGRELPRRREHQRPGDTSRPADQLVRG